MARSLSRNASFVVIYSNMVLDWKYARPVLANFGLGGIIKGGEQLEVGGGSI